MTPNMEERSSVDLVTELPTEPLTLIPEPLATQNLWYVMFSLMLCLAISGNVLILWIIIGNRRMHSVTNYFLFNLSLADLTMASLNGIPNFIYMIQKEWIFGTGLCMVNNFVATLTVASCVFTMTAISIDRYLAIMTLTHRMSRGSARKAICAIWLCSIVLALPSLIFSETVAVNVAGQSVCILVWPDDKKPQDSQMDLSYNLCLLCLTYLIPMGAMGVCYGTMSRELWRQSQIGESTQRQLEAIVAKRKIVRMFIVIMMTFGICWFPYHAYFIYQYFNGDVIYEPWAQDMYLSFYWLAMSTSMINPIVYYFMNSRFRSCMRQAFGKVLFCRQKDERQEIQLLRPLGVQPETPPSHSSGQRTRGIQVVHKDSPNSNHLRVSPAVTKHPKPSPTALLMLSRTQALRHLTTANATGNAETTFC